ncbi:hypothetical protein HPC49_28545 [Pyxidicoccus fallax]|uniref:Uncharacterized protein n=1 Tax=Pyxidicoccus fallax TaxID=394095 RepID=A0A848LAT6_9BACT|nr:hypothetical protein [Pyxidicoccus fallax]NMO15606.1 hypothetical protein [Pyxidicoccus fallax]NPC82155.1 hypothetical protein [Pyxidicoccus fallax]
MSRNTRWSVALFGVLALVFVIGLVLTGGREDVPGAVVDGAPLSEEQEKAAFAQQLMEALRASGVPGEPRYEPQHFRIQTRGPDGGVGMTLFLANTYREYQAAPPERRAEVIARMVKVNLPVDSPASYEEVRPNLMLVVRARTSFELLAEHVGGLGLPSTRGKVPVAWRPLGEVLAVALVQDTPDAMRYLSPEDLERWGVSFDQASADAVANLRLLGAAPLTPLAPGACALSTNDSYGASRLLLGEVIHRCEVKGEPVVLVPNRDTLFITGSGDAKGLLAVAEAAQAAIQAPRPVDGRALRLAPDGWKPFLPEPGSPSRSILQRLAVESRANDYQEQGARLAQQHAREGTDLFVADFIPEDDEHGRSFGQAVWVSGIDTLLPRADVLIFMDQELGPKAPPVAVVRWDLVVRDAGLLLMPEPGMYPERYRVTGFPSKAQLEKWKREPTAMDVP